MKLGALFHWNINYFFNVSKYLDRTKINIHAVYKPLLQIVNFKYLQQLTFDIKLTFFYDFILFDKEITDLRHYQAELNGVGRQKTRTQCLEDAEIIT